MLEQVERIRKYENRKLYSFKEGRYVSLSEVAEKIRQGLAITVETAKGFDITYQTIVSIYKKYVAPRLPERYLISAIRSGQYEFTHKVHELRFPDLKIKKKEDPAPVQEVSKDISLPAGSNGGLS